jgi:hypothetical protein
MRQKSIKQLLFNDISIILNVCHSLQTAAVF